MSNLSVDVKAIPSKQLIWIDKPQQLAHLVKTLADEQLVAVDTESDSLYSYFEKVCLVQFSTASADYLVDPLAVDISELGSFFATSSIEKVFHAAEYDFLSMKRDYGFTFNKVFDTMLAARILGWQRYGLGNILERQFGVKLNKRFQRYDWGKRPLGQKALDYARLDTHYLLPLRRLQLDELKKRNRLREAWEAFERQTEVEPSPKVFDPDDFWRVKGARSLKSQEQAILRNLFALRDEVARKIDRPPFKVLNDAALVRLAKEQPEDLNSMQRLKGVGDKVIQHNGPEILGAIKQGRQGPPPEYPNNHSSRPDEDTMNRYESLRQWRNELAAKRGVEPDVIISNDHLMYIARHNPKSLKALTGLGVLGEWQFETYGKMVLNVLESVVVG